MMMLEQEREGGVWELAGLGTGAGAGAEAEADAEAEAEAESAMQSSPPLSCDAAFVAAAAAVSSRRPIDPRGALALPP